MNVTSDKKPWSTQAIIFSLVIKNSVAVQLKYFAIDNISLSLQSSVIIIIKTPRTCIHYIIGPKGSWKRKQNRRFYKFWYRVENSSEITHGIWKQTVHINFIYQHREEGIMKSIVKRPNKCGLIWIDIHTYIIGHYNFSVRITL